MTLLVTFFYYPAALAVFTSFTIWDGFRPWRYNGFGNYQEMFTQAKYLRAFKNMLFLGAWQVFRAATFPLLGAALVYRLRSESRAYFFRLLFVLPIVVPWVVTVKVWQQFYDPNVGLFNEILKGIGLPGNPFLGSPKTALQSIMFTGFPWIDGVGMLIYLAGLLNIPLEIIEATIVDGCSSLRRFFVLEFPLVIPQLRLLVILGVIGAFQSFGWQLLITLGGPVGATDVPSYQIYNQAITNSRYGMANAIGVILFIAIFSMTLINRATIRSQVEYEAH